MDLTWRVHQLSTPREQSLRLPEHRGSRATSNSRLDGVSDGLTQGNQSICRIRSRSVLTWGLQGRVPVCHVFDSRGADRALQKLSASMQYVSYAAESVTIVLRSARSLSLATRINAEPAKSHPASLTQPCISQSPIPKLFSSVTTRSYRGLSSMNGGGTSTPPLRAPYQQPTVLPPNGVTRGPPSARPSYSSLPFIPGSGRPSTPPVGEYAFSTSLRRQSIGESDGPGHGLSAFLGHSGPSSLRNIVGNGAGESALLPTHAASHDRRGSGPAAPPHHPFAHTAGVTTPSARFARCTITETANQLHTNLDTGLSSSVVPAIREINGSNEFEVAAQERLITKFLKQFYESPLIILLLASAFVSAIVGNLDDAFSITLAIVIVVTGETSVHLHYPYRTLFADNRYLHSGFCARTTVGKELGSLKQACASLLPRGSVSVETYQRAAAQAYLSFAFT